MASYSTVQSVSTPTAPAESGAMPNGGDAIILMMALAGAATSKAARKQYRKAMRKMAWQSLGHSFRSAFKFGDETIAGMPFWLFLVLAIAVAAIGIWLFGLLGFIIVLALAVIIYLLLNKS